MIINPLIYGLTISAKLFMILILAVKIPEQDLAQVGLTMTTVIWIVMFFDYENGTDIGRRIAKAESHYEQEKIFRRYCSYNSTRVVIAFIAFSASLLTNNSILALIFFLSLMETIIFSSRKILLALGLLRASVLVEFARSAPWAIIFSSLIFFEVFEYNSYLFLATWSLSSIIVCVGTFVYLSYIFPKSVVQMPNFTEIPGLLKKNSALFISSFFLVFVETSPRYILEFNGMYEQLAAYVFFSGFVFSIPIFMWIVSIGKNYRGLAAFHSSDENFSIFSTLECYKMILINGVLIFLFLSFASYITVEFLVLYFINGIYEEYLPLLPFLLFLPLLIFLDSVATNALALKGRDWQNLICAVFSILLMMLLLAIWGREFDIWEVPWLLASTYSFSAILRFLSLWFLSGAR
ncbi:MAG: hypothetical protein AB8G77_18140 [Rhodothermales bacterium]